MLKLCGFAGSNYYNKVKLALLEKGIAFEEQLVRADGSPELLEKSPLGKVPYLETEKGTLFESQALLEYIEAAYPEKPLFPKDPFEAAKVRELIIFMELHLELVAREIYPKAFQGKDLPEAVLERAKNLLQRNGKAFAKLAKFSPYIAGSEFTAADVVAVMHLPLVSMASKAAFGEDVLADFAIRDYGKMIGERETMQKVAADRKAYQEAQKARAAQH